MQRTRVLKVVAAAATAMLGVAAFAGPAAAFDDVEGGEFFGPAVEWMKEQGLTTGIGGTVGEPSDTFGPFEPVDRAQLGTFLWRMAGSPEPTLADDGFTDTADDAYYTKAIRWLRQQGYTTGIGGTQAAPSTTFEPHTPVDRAQAITLLWRYGGEPVGDPEPYGPHGFDDVDPGPPPTYFEAALKWAAAEGITTGYGGSDAEPSDVFEPFITLTRGEMATLVWRYAGFPDSDDPGNTQEGAWGPTTPQIVDAEESGAMEVTITYSEAVACDDDAGTAEQFTLHHGGIDELTGTAIDCDDTVTVVLTLDGAIVDAEALHYVEGADGDDHIVGLTGATALSPDSFEFAA